MLAAWWLYPNNGSQFRHAIIAMLARWWNCSEFEIDLKVFLVSCSLRNLMTNFSSFSLRDIIAVKSQRLARCSWRLTRELVVEATLKLIIWSTFKQLSQRTRLVVEISRCFWHRPWELGKRIFIRKLVVKLCDWSFNKHEMIRLFQIHDFE